MDLEEWVQKRDRPLPSIGCSTMFFVLLLLMVVFVVWNYVSYKQ